MTRVWLDRADGFGAGRDVVHGFTGRGGADGGGLTLAAAPGLHDDALVAHWAQALAAVDPSLTPDGLALMTQVHGAMVVRVQGPTGPLATVGQADALITTVPGLALAVRVADCVPVLLAAPGGVAAIHAGWRGVAAAIVPATVQALCAAAGCEPDEVDAVVGPHISGAAYEVGPEVVAGLQASGLTVDVFASPGAGDRWWVDLGAAVDAQLDAAGIVRRWRAGGCTTGDRYYSWRGDGPATGRQAGIIAWCP